MKKYQVWCNEEVGRKNGKPKYKKYIVMEVSDYRTARWLAEDSRSYQYMWIEEVEK